MTYISDINCKSKKVLKVYIFISLWYILKKKNCYLLENNIMKKCKILINQYNFNKSKDAAKIIKCIK